MSTVGPIGSGRNDDDVRMSTFRKDVKICDQPALKDSRAWVGCQCALSVSMQFGALPVLLLLSLVASCYAIRSQMRSTRHTRVSGHRRSQSALYAQDRSELSRMLEDEFEEKFYDTRDGPVNYIAEGAYGAVTNFATSLTSSYANETQRYLPVATAMERIERDMKMLDDVAGQTPQLTGIELMLLISSVGIAAASPNMFAMKVVEVLVPSMAAIAAAVGISAEYVGRVAVSNGKEIAALAIQAAAESEGVLAQSERVKAILPLCVGVATTASAFSLLAPALISELTNMYSVEIITEIFLLFPLLAVLASAIAGLAAQESISLANRASNVGVRRFASSETVGITWKSQAEQVEASSERLSSRWKNFAYGVIPAPLVAAIWPGNLSISCIICAAVAACQAAYYLSIAEYAVGKATVDVALKSKAAAVSDTYANQGSKAGSVLPFTSALAGLCAAASAAVVETLPYIHFVPAQSLLSVFFPTGAALFAAAASVSKARCEVDAQAASTAASRGIIKTDDSENENDPNKMVVELLVTTAKTSNKYIRARFMMFKNLLKSGLLMQKIRRRVSRFVSRRVLGVDWTPVGKNGSKNPRYAGRNI